MSEERPTKRARVIQMIEFDLLPDSVADRMIRSGRVLAQHRSSRGRSVPFHRLVLPSRSKVSRRYQVTVHDFVGEPHKASFTDMYIAGSHRHSEFFSELQRILKSTPVEAGSDQYVGLTLQWLNAVVTYVKHGVVTLSSVLKADTMRQRLTPQQITALPERFDAFTLPMNQSFVLVTDANVLRRPCYNMQSRTVRWKYVYNCVEFEQHTDKPDPVEVNGMSSTPQFARRYELEVVSRVAGTSGCKVLLEDPWPYSLTSDVPLPEGLSDMLQETLARYGVACIPLSHEHIARYTQASAQYLGRLMRLSTDVSLLDVTFVKDRLTQEVQAAEWLYRNKNQLFSRHVHVLTGRTLYGHYCLALKQLFKEIEFLVRCAFAERGNVWTTTAEIVLQY